MVEWWHRPSGFQQPCALTEVLLRCAALSDMYGLTGAWGMRTALDRTSTHRALPRNVLRQSPDKQR